MNDLIPALDMTDDELIGVLGTSVYPGAASASIKLAIGWCKAARKDPLKKPVHIVPMNVKVAGRKRGEDHEWRDVIMPGINDYRTDAARTGEHVGNLPAEFGPMMELEYRATVWEDGPNEKRVPRQVNRVLRYPEWCEFTVLRWVHGAARAFSSGRVYFLECYGTAGKDTDAPNAMWQKRTVGQLEKCAEALALRRGFPEVGSAPTSDEMAGRTTLEVDADGVVIDTATGNVVGQAAGPSTSTPSVRTPRSKSERQALTDDPSPTLPQQQSRHAEPVDRPRPAQTPQQQSTAGGPGMASDGEKAFIKRKLAESGLSVEAACEEVGISSIDNLTADGFIALKEHLASVRS